MIDGCHGMHDVAFTILTAAKRLAIDGDALWQGAVSRRNPVRDAAGEIGWIDFVHDKPECGMARRAKKPSLSVAAHADCLKLALPQVSPEYSTSRQAFATTEKADDNDGQAGSHALGKRSFSARIGDRGKGLVKTAERGGVDFVSQRMRRCWTIMNRQVWWQRDRRKNLPGVFAQFLNPKRLRFAVSNVEGVSVAPETLSRTESQPVIRLVRSTRKALLGECLDRQQGVAKTALPVGGQTIQAERERFRGKVWRINTWQNEEPAVRGNQMTTLCHLRPAPADPLVAQCQMIRARTERKERYRFAAAGYHVTDLRPR